ncbi:MAG: leucine-rich repeat domain-containing protein [Ruminococcus sp.]|nr:leucine-rich repeat domain-containing protein [Ruminococcus sp.]
MKGRFWRKTLAAALALLVVSGNVPISSVADLFGGAAITASAEEGASGQCGENAFWSFDTATGKLTISGTGAMYDYNGTNPWNGYNDNITSVVIENGITSIGELAFYSCKGLTSITIPDSVKSIGFGAFYDCTDLTSITLPDSVTSIGESAFQGCTSLTSVTIPDSVTSIGMDAFYDCTNIADVYCYANPNDLEWDDGCCNDFISSETGKPTICHVPEEHIETYEDNFGGVNVTFKAEKMDKCGDHVYWCFESDPGKLTISGTGTMYDYVYDTPPWYNYKGDITSVKIENGITSIGNGAFYNCTGLTSITIPDSVKSIGGDAFWECTNITDVYCYADPSKLTWDEGGCDDFMGAEESRETVCHVPKKYLEDYEAKFGAGSETPVNVRFVGDVDMGLGEHLYGHSITLDGSIGVNFYVELTGELLASETAEMVFTVPNGSKTYYKFKCSVSAKDMASEITAQLVDGEKSGTKYTYSVKEYADYLLEHTEIEEYANAAPLVKAMLNYGAASQTYFKEGTAIGEVQDMEDVTVPNTFKFDEDNAALPEGVTFEGATLSLRSETTLSLYFKGLPADTKFICNGKTVEAAKNGEYVVARIRGIKANELENDFTVTFNGESMTYNAMAYCYNVLNGGTGDEDLQNVCKALYLYAQAANDYSEQGVNGDE